MFEVNRYDFYEALSFNTWKAGLEVRKDVIHAKGFKDPDEVYGFFKKLYWAWKTPSLRGVMYVYLTQLVDEDLAETTIRPPTDEEIARYTRIGLRQDCSLWEGKRVYRKSPTGKRVPEGLESLVPA